MSKKKSIPQSAGNAKKKQPAKPAKKKVKSAVVEDRTLAALPHSLDPRLRRLVCQAHVPTRLRQDINRGYVTAVASLAETAAPTPADVTKRVLVMLNQHDVPADLNSLSWTRIVDSMFVVKVPIDRLEELGNRPEVRYIEAGRVLTTTLDTSRAEIRADRIHAAPHNLRGAGVIVGVIDVGGLDFTLDDFRRANGATRVLSLWDQRLTPVAGENSPAGFTYGVEYDATAINQALALPNPFQTVRHQPAPASHATHVTSTAAGNGRSQDAAFPANRFVGAAPEADIIFVEAGTEGTAGSFTDSVHVSEAVAYIFERARQLNRPCVINMSLGQNGGSHDGESVVERAIDRLSENQGRAFVVAAGNEHVFRGHASGTLTAGQTRNLRWKVGGGLPFPGVGTLPPSPFGDRTRNEMEIWYSSQDELRVSVTSPGGQTVGPVDAGDSESVTLAGGNRVFIDSVRFSPLNGDAQIYIDVSPPPGGTVQAGEWRVGLQAVTIRQGRFDAWIERDARENQNQFADQSFFVGTDFDPTMTLGTPATGRRTIAVANYDHRTVAVADSSSRGPTRDGRAKPELAAPGTNILAAHALGGRANPAGGVFPMRNSKSGTSMAAPHVTGVVACLLQQNPELTAAQIRKILMASTRVVGGVANFDLAWGHGRVDAEGGVNTLP